MKHSLTILFLFTSLVTSSFSQAERFEELNRNNALFGSEWSFELTNSNSLIFSEVRSLIALEDLETVSVDLSDKDVTTICDKLAEAGFFDLPREISSEVHSLDGATVFLKARCNNETHWVSLLPDFIRPTDKQLWDQLLVFSKSWNLIWDYSKMNPPKLNVNL